VQFPPLTYYQLWHERSHAAPALRWLRELVRDVARALAPPAGKPQ
jgi:DNA-binding transcriptional LysR family regulator